MPTLAIRAIAPFPVRRPDPSSSAKWSPATSPKTHATSNGNSGDTRCGAATTAHGQLAYSLPFVGGAGTTVGTSSAPEFASVLTKLAAAVLLKNLSCPSFTLRDRASSSPPDHVLPLAFPPKGEGQLFLCYILTAEFSTGSNIKSTIIAAQTGTPIKNCDPDF